MDAATLILVDRTRRDRQKFWSASATTRWCSCPANSSFPAAASTSRTTAFRLQRRSRNALEANLLKGSPKITPSRARSLAIAAIREACEETGLCLGRKSDGATPTLEGPWKPFSEAGLLPDPSGLFLIARAITPPGRVRRFDTRFFTADASAIAHRVEGVIHADAELVELVWVEIGSKPLADLHPMTRNVLNELEKRLATGPLSHDARGAVLPFLRRQDAQGCAGGSLRLESSVGWVERSDTHHVMEWVTAIGRAAR